MKVNEKEVAELMAKYELSRADAEQMWLEDNGAIENEEIVEMTKKAKENGTGAKADTKIGVSRTRTVKNSDEKVEIWKDLVEYLGDIYDIEIKTDCKLLEINYNGRNFKLNLSETKKKT